MNKQILISLVALASTAHADEARDAQRHSQDLESLAHSLPKVAPAPGRDTAAVRPPPWCAGLKPPGGTPDAIARHIESGAKYFNTWGSYVDAAELACRWPNEPAVQQAVAVIEQSWINLTGLSEPDAVATLEARLHRERLMADKKRLCDAIAISDEIGGAARAFTLARRGLFGCGGSDAEPAWSTGATVPAELSAYLEVGEPDELVRLALVLDHSSVLLGRRTDDKFLISYVVDGLDYRELSAAAAVKLLDSAPYKDNSYAHATVLESLGRARMAIAAIDAAVKAKAADADWKQLLVTAPERGIAEWTKEAETYKAELARSNDFERKLFGPSVKAMAGCHAELRADFSKVLAKLKHDSVNDVMTSLSHPVASLLFSRLAACMAVDTEPMAAAQVLALVPDVRYSRGPRTAAYAAAVEALGKILEDRSKFAVEPKDFTRFAIPDVGIYRTASDLLSKRSKEKADPMGFVLDGGNRGVVETATKSADGTRVTFPNKSWTYMDQDCVDTKHLIQIRADGTLVYEQRCRDTGLKTVTDKPHDITVPGELAAGIARGALVEFLTTRGTVAFPRAVYADKSKKKLVAFYGFKL